MRYEFLRTSLINGLAGGRNRNIKAGTELLNIRTIKNGTYNYMRKGILESG